VEGFAARAVLIYSINGTTQTALSTVKVVPLCKGQTCEYPRLLLPGNIFTFFFSFFFFSFLQTPFCTRSNVPMTVTGVVMSLPLKGLVWCSQDVGLLVTERVGKTFVDFLEMTY